MGTFISQDVISNGHYETSSLKHRKRMRHTKCKKQSKNVAEKVSFAILVLLLCENMLWFEKLDFQYAKRNSKVCNQQKQNWFVFKSMTYEMRLILYLRSLMMRKRPVRRKISNSFRDHQLKERFCLEKNLFCSKWRCHSLMMIRSHMSRLSTVSWGFSTIWTILLS